MLKPYPLLDKRKQLSNLWLKILLSVLLLVLHPAHVVADNDSLGDFSNNYQNSTVDSNNVTDSTTNNYNATGAGQAAPVMSAIAPTVMGAGGNDSCLMPKSTGIQLSMFGLSSGGVIQDESCNLRKNARLLGSPNTMGGLGLQVSAISVLCQDPTVFRSMVLANTPCPISDTKTGKLLMGKKAINKYRENPEQYIVGYNLDPDFWDTLLKVEEETDEVTSAIKDDGPVLSLSDRFRTSKRTRLSNNNDRSGKDPVPDNND